ncbi:hypothetical protein D3C87_1710370 [compost metagenome]
MRDGNRDMGVDQAEGRIELEEWQRENGRRRHSVGQKPEEQVLVAQKPVAREGIGCRQRHEDGDNRVHHHIDDRVDIAVIPGRIGEDDGVVSKRRICRPERQLAQNLAIGLEAHVDEPVDRQK